MRTDYDTEEGSRAPMLCGIQEMGHMIEALHEVEADFENLPAASTFRSQVKVLCMHCLHCLSFLGFDQTASCQWARTAAAART